LSRDLVGSAAPSFRLAESCDLELVLQIDRGVGTWLHGVKHIADQWPREVPEDEALRMINSNSLYLQHPKCGWYAPFEKRLRMKE
jgi:hypothetical protein